MIETLDASDGLTGTLWVLWHILEKYVLIQQHFRKMCVYGCRAVEVKVSRGEFEHKLRHWPPGTNIPKWSCRLFCQPPLIFQLCPGTK